MRLVVFSISLFMFTSSHAFECHKGLPDQLGGLPSEIPNNCYIEGETLYINGILQHEVTSYILNHPIKTLILNSYGGSTSAVNAVLEHVRKEKIKTSVPANGYCISACTMLYQAGVNREAYKSSTFLYHCVGLGKFGHQIFVNSCGEDLNDLTPTCKKDLQDFEDISTKSTKDYFQDYIKYGSKDLFELMMSLPDESHWFESGNFCRKQLKIWGDMAHKFNVVEILHLDKPNAD